MYQDPAGGGAHHQHRGAESGGEQHPAPPPLLRQAQDHHGHLVVGEPDQAPGPAQPGHRQVLRGKGSDKLPSTPAGNIHYTP